MDANKRGVVLVLRRPGLHATNNLAERAIRLMAMARKKLGRQSYGQRCPHASNIGSVLRTCWQQGKHAFAELVHLQRSARPILLEIIPPTPSP